MDQGGDDPLRCAPLQLEALAKAAEEDLERDRVEGADVPAIRAFEDFKKKMRRRGDSDKKRAEKLARRHARCAIVLPHVAVKAQHCMHVRPGGSAACPVQAFLMYVCGLCRAKAALQEAEAEGEQPGQQSNGHAHASSSREASRSNGKSHRSHGQVWLPLTHILHGLAKTPGLLLH